MLKLTQIIISCDPKTSGVMKNVEFCTSVTCIQWFTCHAISECAEPLIINGSVELLTERIVLCLHFWHILYSREHLMIAVVYMTVVHNDLLTHC